MEGQESDAKPVNHLMAWRLAGIPPLDYDILPDFNRDRTATISSDLLDRFQEVALLASIGQGSLETSEDWRHCEARMSGSAAFISSPIPRRSW